MLGTGANKQWIYENHPEAYVKTRSGIDSHETPIYGMSHYKFLCPNRPIVRDFLKGMYNHVSKLKGLDGINLDYIRYIEVNPEFDPIGDTCYCDYCTSHFYNITGIDIKKYSPADVFDWIDYRINSITSLVNEIAEIVHANGLKITADVYPGPLQSRFQTKQKWDQWNLDMVFPMLYTQVFNRSVEWIGKSTKEGKNALKSENKTTILFTGLQAEAMSDEDFRNGVKLSLENGATGISLFRLDTINIEKFGIVREEINRFLSKKENEGEK